jgi:hypothetical protein
MVMSNRADALRAQCIRCGGARLRVVTGELDGRHALVTGQRGQTAVRDTSTWALSNTKPEFEYVGEGACI